MARILRWPEPNSQHLRQPWRPLESVTDNHPELVNCFRERRARGGKLFPRTQFMGAVSATVVVVAPTATTGSFARRKQPRSFGREGKASQLGRRHLPRSQAAPLTSRPSSLGRGGAWRSRFHSLGSFKVNSGPAPAPMVGPSDLGLPDPSGQTGPWRPPRHGQAAACCRGSGR